MTSVVGILNKKGVALAADSAVTRNVASFEKVTNNGNKMLRLSDNGSVPVCVMVTGNAEFLGVPWDLIIRRYRQDRGTVAHPTVEAASKDLFKYISDSAVFWNKGMLDRFLMDQSRQLYAFLVRKAGGEYGMTVFEDDLFPSELQGPILEEMDRMLGDLGKLPFRESMEDYSDEDFHETAWPAIRNFFEGFSADMDSLGDIPSVFERVLKERLSRCVETDTGSLLVFCGYGTDEKYPSLIPVQVDGGTGSFSTGYRVCRFVLEDEAVHISDERPSAICPFAQVDVTQAIMHGMHDEWFNAGFGKLRDELIPWNHLPMDIDCNIRVRADIEVGKGRLRDTFRKGMHSHFAEEEAGWVECVRHRDVDSLCRVAEKFIDLTGFHRMITFRQESVGGPIDLAVITRKDGFRWKYRKSWYHHKDVGGRYGKLGV